MPFTETTREFIFTPGAFFPQCHASTLVVLPRGTIVAAWFAGSHEKNPDVAIWLSRRTETGWSDPVVVADEPGVPCWNPVLFRDDTGDGRLYLFYKVGHTIPAWSTMVCDSADRGATWSAPRELVAADSGGRGPVKNKPVVLADGAWLAPASVETATEWNAFADRSTDGGRTWTASPFVPLDRAVMKGKGVIQPTLWESAPGNVHMLLRSTDGFVYRSDSTDSGRTWCSAYRTALPNNNSGIDVVRLENRTLVLVYNPVAGDWAARTPIVCRLSTDNGATWRDEYVLDDADSAAAAFPGADASTAAVERKREHEFSYPAVVATGSDVHVTYTWNRSTVAYRKLTVRE